MGTDHPDVLAAIEEEAKSVRVSEFPITVEMYMTALKGGIDQARARTKEVDPGGTRYATGIYTCQFARGKDSLNTLRKHARKILSFI